MVRSPSVKHGKRKARAVSPDEDNTEDLVEELIARATKPEHKRLKSSLSAARRETNAGLKSKQKGKGKGVAHKVTKAVVQAAGPSGSESRKTSSSLLKHAPLEVGCILLLPHGLKDNGDIRTSSAYTTSQLEMYKRCGLAVTETPGDDRILISPDITRDDINDLLKACFPLYFDWLAAQGVDIGSSYHWRIVARDRRRVIIPYFNDNRPMDFVGICRAVHGKTSRWQDRTWCFVSSISIPKSVWQSWGTTQSAVDVPQRRDWTDTQLANYAPSSDSDSDEQVGSKPDVGSSSDAEAESGDETDVSEWAAPAHKSKTSRKLGKVVATLGSSLASIQLGTPEPEPGTGNSVAGSSSNATGPASTSELGSAANPIVFSSSVEDLGEVSLEASPERPPFTQPFSSQAGSSRETRASVWIPPPVTMSRGEVADDPWAY
ncbi:uncharacterized protein B0H18DRAFT_1121439 [Fomitopsis serialis]|uniref:uncharacterized protein n=1 Tax=Fomitopsis serialis TaxID=139415 RepID=UPI0020073B6E|nr:uncharacterized protein B0H18DRAFT_1121439 [Neoantrodia serialis]KAH9921287.1 hypothetical protein B0H18DRAFT_1121439 [Neoantrodia serialis]